ncbi:transposase [Aidingimonas lacisalsi]|uniref:transposase n=1 Tax=Aidingimonas lacisalsi TaxID=2604086 RepID=UPI0011D2AC71|nr:transposase [Aidingimonas lacisalsi]
MVANLLDAQDWTPFEDRYAATGRAPYAPRAMMGLILYGIMHGVSSLRSLERLARVDLGAMWVTGGIASDHANIGRLICLHEQALSQTFVEDLARTVLARTGTSTACLALQQIMTHPGAQTVFRQRKAMVEPVFSRLRQQQGLPRFRRRELAGVKREFALHALAYNLARAVALSLYRILWVLWWRYLGRFA